MTAAIREWTADDDRRLRIALARGACLMDVVRVCGHGRSMVYRAAERLRLHMPGTGRRTGEQMAEGVAIARAVWGSPLPRSRQASQPVRALNAIRHDAYMHRYRDQRPAPWEVSHDRA